MEGTNRFDVIKLDVEKLHKYLEHFLQVNDVKKIEEINHQLDRWREYLLNQ